MLLLQALVNQVTSDEYHEEDLDDDWRDLLGQLDALLLVSNSALAEEAVFSLAWWAYSVKWEGGMLVVKRCDPDLHALMRASLHSGNSKVPLAHSATHAIMQALRLSAQHTQTHRCSACSRATHAH